MQQNRPSDPELERIISAIRHCHSPPSQGITVIELINAVFLILAGSERYDLADEVVQLIPQSAQGELRRVVESILQPGAAYAPFTIGRPADPAAWRQRMVPACRRIAALFRQHLDAVQGDSGLAGP
jgi:hypothetical protein